MTKFNRLSNFILLAVILVAIGCTKKVENEITDRVLARVGDKEIYVNEFIKRAEYTPRPPYCKMDYNLHKKIILNTLIAEKMFSIEAGEDNVLTNNKHFQAYIKGREQQAMREWLYIKEGLQKTKIDTNQIKNIYKHAGKTYDISFFTVEDEAVATKIKEAFKTGEYSFEEVFHELAGDSAKIPQREINYLNEDNPVIEDAFYTQKVDKNQVIGPLKIEKDFYITMKVNGWKLEPAITNQQVQTRWHDIKEKLTLRESLKIYEKFVARVLKGKRVDFQRDTFIQFIKAIKPMYIKSKEEQQNIMNKNFWKTGDNEFSVDSTIANLEQIKNEPVLSDNGQVWTVEDLVTELKSHPLVFRNRKMDASEFPEQVRLAVVDLIRDKYLNEVAYKRGYDQAFHVKQNVNMWKDNMNGAFQKNLFLASKGLDETFDKKQYMQLFDDYLNPYVDSLQTKYSDQIEVNVEAFDDIKLTRIDMFVLNKGMPFPVVVPGFPLITTDDRLDYGKKMEQSQNE